MNDQELTAQFRKMGARVNIGPPRPRWRQAERPLRVNVLSDRKGEFFDIELRKPAVELSALDVKADARHLLLMASFAEDRHKEKFLCGHDERAWFVAAVPEARGVANVRTAMEALKPGPVRIEQSRRRVRFRDLGRRRTEAYIRQGEWFFVPRPEFEAPAMWVLRNEPIRRGGGKPHRVQQLVRSAGETVYVSPAYPNGLPENAYRDLVRANPEVRKQRWQVMRRNAKVFARGAVSHPDHKTIYLPCWHEVFMNTESQAPAMQNVAFLD